jgi:spore germination protein YaaH
MASPQAIAQHAQTLTNLVMQHGYDGIELDYEHLWSSSDRAPYTALMQAVATSLHAQGKELTLALPAMDHDMPDAAYDYTQLQDIVDVMHLMAYDFHYMGGDHLGPLAPKGWVNDVVTRVQSLGKPDKYVLGLANYGISTGWYTSAKDAAARCGGNYSSQTDHMTSCPLGHQDPGLAPHCTTSNGDVWFEDVASMTEKAALAKAHGLGGVGYWTMGDEPSGFFDAMKTIF